MTIGDLVTIRNHPEHVGIITDLNKEDGTGWIAVLWVNSTSQRFKEFRIPLSSAHHIEVMK